MTASARQRGPIALGLLLFFVVLAGVGLVSVQRAGGHLIYPDDGYITMAAARQLRQHGQWGVTPFEFSGSVTSLTWPLLLASWDLLGGGRDIGPFALNVLFGAAAVALTLWGLSRYIVGGTWRLAAAAAIIFATPLPALAFFGLEHTLQCLSALALMLAGVRACCARDERERGRLVALTAACAAIAIATRYDSASVLAGVLLAIAATLGWQPAAIVAAAAAVPPALYAVLASRHGWPLVPIGVLLKGRVEGITAGIHALNGTPALEALVAAALVLLVALLRAREPETREPRLLLVVFLVAALLHVQFGRTGVPFRYEAYLMALGLFADVAALAASVRRFAPRPAIVWVATALVLYPLATRAIETHTVIAEMGRVSYEHEYQQGRFLAKYPQPGAVMLVDLGAIAYFSDLRLVDLGALASLDVARHDMSGHSEWTADGLRQLAAAHGVRIAIDVQGPLPLPVEWIRVGAWSAPGQAVEFFAVDAAAASSLARDLRAGERDLPERMTLRVFVEPGRDEKAGLDR